MIDQKKTLLDQAGAPIEDRPWDEGIFTAAEPPPDWQPPVKRSGPGLPPPQIIRTVNLLEMPEHSLAGADITSIADFILARAREGIGDILNDPSYALGDDVEELSADELFARWTAEHQTGIPYSQPTYFYPNGQKGIAQAIGKENMYPLAGQCQQSVTSALCFGGWDGGIYGDIGSDINAQLRAAKLGKGLTPEALAAPCAKGKSGLVLTDWPEDLWNEFGVGTCLFWSAPCPMTKDGQTCEGSVHVPGCGQGSGHVAMVIRKHPFERKWQLWDTTTSYADPTTHAGVKYGARMLWESHWWSYISTTLQSGAWPFRGIASLKDIPGRLITPQAPRGKTRLLLRKRSDKSLLYRGPWMDMQAENLPITWLLRSLRGAPHFETIEPVWCIDSPGYSGKPSLPLLDCSCDTRGNATMSWNPSQGSHNRTIPSSVWQPATVFPEPPKPPPSETTSLTGGTTSNVIGTGELKHAPIANVPELESIMTGKSSPLRRGSKGPGVKAIQLTLIQLKYLADGSADGDFGPRTETAVKSFQAAQKLVADAIVGKGTLGAMDNALA